MSPNILFTLGCLLATLLINRLGRRKMLIHSFLWSVMSLVLIGVAQVLEYVYPNELLTPGWGASLRCARAWERRWHPLTTTSRSRRSGT